MFSFSLLCEGVVGRQLSVSSHQNWPYWHPGLRLSTSRTLRNNFLLWDFAMAAWATVSCIVSKMQAKMTLKYDLHTHQTGIHLKGFVKIVTDKLLESNWAISLNVEDFHPLGPRNLTVISNLRNSHTQARALSPHPPKKFAAVFFWCGRIFGSSSKIVNKQCYACIMKLYSAIKINSLNPTLSMENQLQKPMTFSLFADFFRFILSAK